MLKVVVFLVGLAVAGVIAGKLIDRQGTSVAPSQSAAPQKVASEADKAKQSARKAFIQKLIANGILQKVEIPGNLPHAWVTPRFLALDFDDKRKFMDVVNSYYYIEDSSYDMVILYHSKTGKKIGSYSAEYGLDVDS